MPEKDMFTKKQTIIVFILLLLGLLVAAKLYHIDLMVNYSGEPYKSFCNVNETFNCDAVAASPYSRLFGIPVAFIGVISNLFLIIFLWVGRRLKHLKEHLIKFYLLSFFIYLLGCIIFALISFLLMSSHCFVCMIFWGIILCSFCYLLTISNGVWKNPKALILNVCQGLWRHKGMVCLMAVVYIGINVNEGLRLSYAGCPKKGHNPLQCEHFEVGTQTAFLGRDSAKIDVIVYTDFECPWCRRAHYALMDMIKKYEKQVRFIRKEFPLDIECNSLLRQPFHDVACKAAFYAKCAGQQGKYWEYHDELYRNQEILSEEVFLNIGKMLSLDTGKLKECAAGDPVRKIIQKEIEEASSYHINGTPTFRIFGELFVGMINEQILNDYLTFYPAIRPEVLKRIFLGGYNKYIQIIDIRESSEFNNGHIDGAMNIPLSILSSAAYPSITNVLNSKIPTLVYDHDGTRVTQGFDILRNEVMDIHTLLGGYNNWVSLEALK